MKTLEPFQGMIFKKPFGVGASSPSRDLFIQFIRKLALYFHGVFYFAYPVFWTSKACPLNILDILAFFEQLLRMYGFAKALMHQLTHIIVAGHYIGTDVLQVPLQVQCC